MQSAVESVSNPGPVAKIAGQKRVLLLKPRGFCAGVVRAIDIVKIALETFGAPIYVRREIVHNRFVVNELAEKGAIFVHEIEEVPEGQRVIYSAHGVSPAVREASKARGLKVIDATCPLVTKVHVDAVKFAKQGYSLVLVGHRDHDEIEGTLGEAPEATQVVSNVAEVEALVVPDPDRVAYLTQTTLSLDEARDIIQALKVKFPNIVGPHTQDICYATENRQVAVRNVAPGADVVLVVGSHILRHDLHFLHARIPVLQQVSNHVLHQNLRRRGTRRHRHRLHTHQPCRINRLRVVDQVRLCPQVVRNLHQSVRVRTVRRAHHQHHIRAWGHIPHRHLAVLRRIADILRVRSHNIRELHLQRLDNIPRLVQRQRRLRQIRHAIRIRHGWWVWSRWR